MEQIIGVWNQNRLNAVDGVNQPLHIGEFDQPMFDRLKALIK